MKIHPEKALHLGVAAVTFAAVFGLDPLIVALLLAAFNIGLAIFASH